MISIKLKLLKPLHLAASHTVAPMASTLDYSPGTAVRGALAQKYLDQPGQAEDQDFKNWFLADEVRFSPLLPLGTSQKYASACEPLPLTAFKCKLYPGFKTRDAGNHGVRDMLFEFIRGHGRLPDDRCESQGCESHLIPADGFYAPDGGLIEIRKHLETRTAIDSQTETAAQQQLFSLEVLEEEQVFGGSIDLASIEQEQLFTQKLMREGLELRLGAARTRGLGLAQIIQVSTIASLPASQKTLAARLTAFSEYAINDQQIECDKRLCFVLTLVSDCVIRDEFLRFGGTITPQVLGRYVHPALANASLLGAFTRTRMVDGWNAAQKNPRPTEIAICAGSVFAFGIDAAAPELAAYLQYLERDGLGERTQEGYGRLVIDHEFHKQEGQR